MRRTKMIWSDLGTLGAPSGDSRHHRLRFAASLVAAVSGAVAILVLGFIIISGEGPGDATWAWILLPALVVVWLSGLWWRWDSPDRRKQTDERERRGY
jgi:O-antigen/teichoic acid export membrane protein